MPRYTNWKFIDNTFTGNRADIEWQTTVTPGNTASPAPRYRTIVTVTVGQLPYYIVFVNGVMENNPYAGLSSSAETQLRAFMAGVSVGPTGVVTLSSPTPAVYVFPLNPNQMTSPFGERNITANGTTSPNGQPLFFEGAKSVPQWTFSGNCPTAAQYEALRSWVYDRTGRRVQVVDHFGRVIDVVLRNFDAVPRKDKNRYWHHTYTITCHVINVGHPTIGEVWR